MAEVNEVFKCDICGNLVEVLHGTPAPIVCCGKPMEKLNAKTEDQGMEKHVPVIEKTDNGFKVKVGEIAHPMEDEHFIEFIEVIADGKISRKQLKPGDAPEAEFCVCAENVIAREYCSLHGLWKNK